MEDPTRRQPEPEGGSNSREAPTRGRLELEGGSNSTMARTRGRLQHEDGSYSRSAPTWNRNFRIYHQIRQKFLSSDNLLTGSWTAVSDIRFDCLKPEMSIPYKIDAFGFGRQLWCHVHQFSSQWANCIIETDIYRFRYNFEGKSVNWLFFEKNLLW